LVDVHLDDEFKLIVVGHGYRASPAICVVSGRRDRVLVARGGED
jgi:hypothetical protein